MTRRAQKRLAIAGVVLLLAGFVGANAHLLAVALGSQPECTLAADTMPAKQAC